MPDAFILLLIITVLHYTHTATPLSIAHTHRMYKGVHTCMYESIHAHTRANMAHIHEHASLYYTTHIQQPLSQLHTPTGCIKELMYVCHVGTCVCMDGFIHTGVDMHTYMYTQTCRHAYITLHTHAHTWTHGIHHLAQTLYLSSPRHM